MGDAAFAAATAAIIEAGRRMDARGWVPATAGNFSVRLPGGVAAITRSGRHKGMLRPGDTMLVDMDGAAAEAGARPSYETAPHCGIFRRFAEAGAVLHGHSIANTALSRQADDAVRLAGYELPGRRAA